MNNPRQTIGKSTLQVGRLGLGCMGMSEFYGGTRDEAAHVRLLHAALDWASTTSTPPTCMAPDTTSRCWPAPSAIAGGG